jgi:hypothetical protein
MTPYYAPPGYALVRGRNKYHLVRVGTDVTICPSMLPTVGVKRIDRGVLSFKVCLKCKYYWCVNNDN